MFLEISENSCWIKTVTLNSVSYLCLKLDLLLKSVKDFSLIGCLSAVPQNIQVFVNFGEY